MTVPRLSAALIAIAMLAVSGACSSKSEGTSCNAPGNSAMGTKCTITWSGCSNGSAYSIECSNTPPATSTTCACRENSVAKATFQLNDLVCSMSGSASTAAASTGCGWDLKVP